MTYLEKIKQAQNSTEAQKIIFNVLDAAMDEAYNMRANERHKETSWEDWFAPATVKVLNMEAEE